MSIKPIKPENSEQKTTAKNGDSGGNKYFQMKIANEKLFVHNPISGHTQKSNVKE